MEPVELPLFLGHEEPILGRFTARELGLVAGSALTGLLLIALDWWPPGVTLPLVAVIVGLSGLEACVVHQGHRPAWWLAHWLAFGLSPRTWVWQRPRSAAPSTAAAARTGAFTPIDPANLEPTWLSSTRSHRTREVQ